MININKINERLTKDPMAFAGEANAFYEKRIESVAKDIYMHRQDNPVILLAGPSGSGKTTSALKIEQLLDSWGCDTHTLSMDNYFFPFNPSDHKMAALGNIDLETPGRVDVRFLNEQLKRMINSDAVSLPRYDFTTSTRQFPGNILRRRPGELVILEGIHALNPAVITIPDALTARVYVSVRTRVTDGEVVLHPSKIRLMRRMVRDRLYRNRTIAETMRLYSNVERGEANYIMPHKPRATHEIDTIIPYEVNAYRSFLFDDLSKLTGEQQAPIADMMRIIECAAPLEGAHIPANALIREFIGEGQFDY